MNDLWPPETVDTYIHVHEEPRFRLEQVALEPEQPLWEWQCEHEGLFSLDLHTLWETLWRELRLDTGSQWQPGSGPDILHSFELEAEVAEGEVVFKARKAKHETG